MCRERGVLFHSDAVQALGKVPLDVDKMSLDLASLTAHKLYGPKGCGALYVRSKNPQVKISALIDGGGHEHGMRSGTLNVPGIVGFGKACEIAQQEMAEEGRRVGGLRDRLRDKLTAELDEVSINGSMEHRLPGNLNMSFRYAEGESLLVGLNDIAVSSGAACTSASIEPSYVLKALGLDDELAHSTIRFGVGRFNTEAEIDYVVGRVVEVVKSLRELSPR
jgi:cysteine desulfurase